MNKEKVGEPFHYPDTFVLLLSYAKAYFHLLYTQAEEGIARGHTKVKVPATPGHTTINRLNIKVKDVEDTDRILKMNILSLQ